VDDPVEGEPGLSRARRRIGVVCGDHRRYGHRGRQPASRRAGLESALGRPRAYAHYEEADLALQAAVLAHGIAESQTFIDGNKRLALVAMLTFLEINGYRVEAPDSELAAWILSLSAGATPAQLGKILRDRLRAIP